MLRSGSLLALSVVLTALLMAAILPANAPAQDDGEVAVYKAVVGHFRRDDAFIRIGWQGKTGIDESCEVNVLDDVDDETRGKFFYWASPLLTRGVAREVRAGVKDGGVGRDWLVRNGIFSADELVDQSVSRAGANQDGVETDPQYKGCRWFFSPVVRRDDLAYVFVHVWCGMKSSVNSVVISRKTGDAWQVVDVAWLGMS